ncbi:DUF4375 domain-containing protein [Pelomonas sp. UHG3]|uniref:DUF4375 domain-containing protein n=1 Tax=Roseateles hydrophilus TaxID=2975054 RepID=A0ACC6CB36_9BURK|nr:DUF4375 domain-containing protein [Pelomonas sp. UHG3]MCY4745673.1 DUF4375 domain-containing protein [Pelomonas sp. UHG3]
MIQRLPCSACGELIHPDTASKNAGLCMPCNGGYRERIEEGKRQRVREREIEKSPGRIYWRGLVGRVHGEPNGFSRLRPEEKTYYAIRCLIGEVYNGGFYQYFANSSGNMYAHAIDGLLELEATQTLQLLTRAKELLLGEQPVPLDQTERDRMLPDIELFGSSFRGLAEELRLVEQRFWSDPESLDDRCTGFAQSHNLYGDH